MDNRCISEKNVSAEKWANTILRMWKRHINCKKQGVICLLRFERSFIGQLSCVLQQVPLFKKEVVSLKASNENNQLDRKFDLWGEKKEENEVQLVKYIITIAKMEM